MRSIHDSDFYQTYKENSVLFDSEFGTARFLNPDFKEAVFESEKPAVYDSDN